MKSFHDLEQTLAFRDIPDFNQTIQNPKIAEIRIKSDQFACLKYLELHSQESPTWQALELLDNFVRDQMAECDSLVRVLNQVQQQQ